MNELQTNVMTRNLFTATDITWISKERQSYLQQMAKDINSRYQKALQSIREGDGASARKIFESLKERQSKEKAFGDGYVIAGLAIGDPEAESALTEKLTQEQNSSPYHYLQGMVWERECDYVRAIEEYTISVEKDLDFIPALFRLAYLTDLRGDEEQAMEIYQQCRELGADYPNLLLNLGGLYEDIQQYDRAVECYRKALEKDPGNKRAAMFLQDVQASFNMYVDDEKERENSKMAQILATPITDFELSVRSRNCLNKMKIRTLGDLIEKSEAELLSYKNFGETSLGEIKEILAKKGLKLGMGIEDKNIAKKKEKREKKGGPAPIGQDLDMSVSSLELSVRSRKCLTSLNIQTVAELLQKKESDLLLCKNFGSTSLQEIKRKLAELGMALSGE